MPVIMKDNVQYAYTTKGTVFHTLSNAEYEALTEEEKMNGDVYCIPDREPILNPDEVWAKIGTGTLDIGDDLTDGVNQLNSSFSQLDGLTVYKNLTPQTSYADFDDGSTLPLISLTSNIDPIQDLHGYDYPWVGGAGKNKFDIGDVSSSYWNVSGEQITNTITDTRQNFQLVIQCYYNGQYTGINYLQEIITSTGRVSFTFTIGNNDNVDQLLVKHNGGQQDIVISFVNWTQKGDVTISFDVSGYNPTVVGGIVFSNIQIESGSTATTFAPYSNICPISGWDEVNVTVADDVENPTVSNTYTIDLDGTRYGGTLDVVSGVLTVDRVYKQVKDFEWQTQAGYYGRFFTVPSGADKALYDSNKTLIISDTYKGYSDASKPANTNGVYVGSGGSIKVWDSEYTEETDVDAWKTARANVELCYYLATPQTIQLTPTQVNSLLGQNYISCDTGNITNIKYLGILNLS